ncbi:MAG: hypothetical protein IJ669_04755 [Prevotella sp.]|jgi:hypothetical protein|nr:hypothetical protein [Prevotella sp.]
MRNIHIIIVVLIIALFASCNNTDKKTMNSGILNDSIDNEETLDSTIYGKCVDAAMSSIIIEDEAGDTITFMLETSDKSAEIHGGILVGDKMAIISENVEGENFAKLVINTTSLLGKWTSIAKNFDIEEAGIVHSHVKAESNPYTTWKIHNGQLILNKDTFSIRLLGPDSLLIENKEGIFDYKRQK